MADFTEAIQRQQAKRSPDKEALSFSDFCDLKDTVALGITGVSDIKLLSEQYKTDLLMRGKSGTAKEGKVFATIGIDTADEDGYDTLLARINDEIAENAFGANVETVEDIDERNWSYRYSAKVGNDAVSLSFIVRGRVITATLDNYLDDSTLAKFETWADTIGILSDGVE